MNSLFLCPVSFLAASLNVTFVALSSIARLKLILNYLVLLASFPLEYLGAYFLAIPL